MRKIRLDLATLSIESFPTTPAAHARGTVQGHGPTDQYQCSNGLSCITCGETCPTNCETCDPTECGVCTFQVTDCGTCIDASCGQTYCGTCDPYCCCTCSCY